MTHAQIFHSIGISEHVDRLLQRVVLRYGNDHNGGTPMSRDNDVLVELLDIVKWRSWIAPRLADEAGGPGSCLVERAPAGTCGGSAGIDW